MSLQVSVVIIGRNEGERLERCIRSVQAMHYPLEQVEIIYVDSQSSDGSPERAKSLGINVLTVSPKRPAAAIGRNAGWRAAQAPFVLFLDGDTLLHPDFVSTAMQILQDPKIAAVSGHRRESNPNYSIYQRVLDLDWISPPGIAEFCGGDALIRREVLQAVDGYDPSLIAGEEPEMCQRIRTLGYTIMQIDHPMTLHDLAIARGSQYWKRTMRAGHAYAEISTRLSNTAYPLWRRESHKNFLHATALILLLTGAVVASISLQAIWPILSGIGILLFFSLRTALKFRWKSNDWITLLLYGIHSHLQHIPIAWGQCSYFYHRWRGKRQRLIEYK